MQDGDASEDSSAPTHSDSRGSKPRELNGIMGNAGTQACPDLCLKLVCSGPPFCPGQLPFSESKVDFPFLSCLSRWKLSDLTFLFRSSFCPRLSSFPHFGLRSSSSSSSLLSPLSSSPGPPLSLELALSVSEVALAQIPR